MPETDAVEQCDLSFAEGLALGDAGEVALEDYARVLTGAASGRGHPR